MKLRTLCCNKTVLRKDITRFVPLWAIYLIGGLLVMLSTTAGASAGGAARSLADTIGGFSIINMIYAVLCAQLLFGDLFKSRMCNALHAMPLRRESWFLTHTVAGLLFSLVPHMIAVALLAVLMLGEFWFVGLYWLLGMTLEFLFFFGLAVFSVFCVGNRVAQAAVYGILNFASMIVYWFVYTIYEPLLYGVKISDRMFIKFCPVVQMTTTNNLVLFERVQKDSHYYENPVYLYKGLGEGWGYLAICAAIGVALFVLALLLYRRRKLECAGNFIAIAPLEPIFAVVFTLCAGCVFASFGQLFDGGWVVYFVVGIVIGWFVALMLLRRTVKVFQWKSFLKLAILGIAVAGSLLLTQLDLLGVTRWQPKPEQVAVVEVNTGSQIYATSNNYLKLEESAEIQRLLEIHSTIIKEGKLEKRNVRMRTFTIRYTLKDGRQVSRTYPIYAETATWSEMQRLYNTPETIMGYEDWKSFVRDVEPRIEGYSVRELCRQYNKKYGILFDAEKIQLELLEAIRKDCEAGRITQGMFADDKVAPMYYVELEWNNQWRYLEIPSKASSTIMWFQTYKEIIAMSEK